MFVCGLGTKQSLLDRTLTVKEGVLPDDNVDFFGFVFLAALPSFSFFYHQNEFYASRSKRYQMPW